MDYYREDPMVLRAVGLKRLPDVSTVSRVLSKTDAEGVINIGEKNQEMVLGRLKELGLRRVTMDFDGSVLSSEMAEGTAVGFNKRKKGQRSYYPLFCTIAQTGQVLALLMRSGNVHDSNGVYSESGDADYEPAARA